MCPDACIAVFQLVVGRQRHRKISAFKKNYLLLFIFIYIIYFFKKLFIFSLVIKGFLWWNVLFILSKLSEILHCGSEEIGCCTKAFTFLFSQLHHCHTWEPPVSKTLLESNMTTSTEEEKLPKLWESSQKSPQFAWHWMFSLFSLLDSFLMKAMLPWTSLSAWQVVDGRTNKSASQDGTMWPPGFQFHCTGNGLPFHMPV